MKPMTLQQIEEKATSTMAALRQLEARLKDIALTDDERKEITRRGQELYIILKKYRNKYVAACCK